MSNQPPPSPHFAAIFLKRRAYDTALTKVVASLFVIVLDVPRIRTAHLMASHFAIQSVLVFVLDVYHALCMLHAPI